jgi:predicted ArsR family transcriptional regulator
MIPKLGYHPKSYLSSVRNVPLGLRSRTVILNVLEIGERTAREIVMQANISYARVLHHLHLLEREKLVERIGQKPPFLWRMTEYGQRRLV